MMKQFRTTGGMTSVLFGLMAAGIFLAGCATEPTWSEIPGVATATTTTNEPAPPTDKFQVGDLVTITFSGISLETMPAHEERIKEDGTITLNLIGPIKAAGKSAGELQKEIRREYVPKWFNETLTVTVTPQPRYYFVGGEVRSAGPKEWLPQTTVTKAIQAAGGFTDFANKKKVKLTREQHTQSINCIKAIDDPTYDVPVYPGDSIHVPRRFW